MSTKQCGNWTAVCRKAGWTEAIAEVEEATRKPNQLWTHWVEIYIYNAKNKQKAWLYIKFCRLKKSILPLLSVNIHLLGTFSKFPGFFFCTGI